LISKRGQKMPKKVLEIAGLNGKFVTFLVALSKYFIKASDNSDLPENTQPPNPKTFKIKILCE
jgi:hypothetical protein